MAIRTRKQALAAAKKTTRNSVGMCQKVTREWYNAPSVGDVDGDRDADAVDGWLSEPKSKRHPGDRNPPAGVPLAFSGGSRGHGHRAISDVKGVVSIDMLNNRYKAGYTSTVTGTSTAAAIATIERSMGVRYLGWSETISGLAIPADPTLPPPVKRKTLTRKFMHLSLQFSDTNAQKQHDVDKAFALGIPYIGGTEMRGDRAILEKYATKYGYRLSTSDRFDTWVAIKKKLIKAGSWRAGADFQINGSAKTPGNPPGKWGPKAIVWGQYEDTALGTVSLGAVHRLTAGGAGAALKRSSDLLMAKKEQAWGKKHGAGTDLAFLTGDFNLNDKMYDVFKGVNGFTTSADELKMWPNTAHGPIDAIASWDQDARVKWMKLEVLNDKNFFLYTDHYAVVATAQIAVL